MPAKKRKSKEEKTAEEFFPVDESDLKKTTEKTTTKPVAKEELLKGSIEISIKESPKEEILRGAIEKTYKNVDKGTLETVEKIKGNKKIKSYGKRRFSKLQSKRTKKIVNIAKEFIPQKISLKKQGYELIITEKPQAAMKIASALGSSKKLNNQGIPYYEVNRKGNEIVVACAVGHLFTLSQNNSGSSIPTFDISWKPNFLVRKRDFTKKYYDTLLKLAKGAGSLTVATDFDIEGEVIGLNVIRYIASQKDANRMKFSTLTNTELNEAYETKHQTLEWGQAIAGETRHFLDWFYGINLSRALMNAIKTTGKFKIMSIGRVQGPALELIVKKEKEILAFKSVPYWQVFITVDDGKNKLVLKYIQDIFDKKELDKFKNLKGKTALAETSKTSQTLPPQAPFDLTTLQTEAYKFYGITPSKTLQAAQSLYLAGLISYPRTSSQKLPFSINYIEILKKLAKQYDVERLITKDKPVEGKKTDPAHPSIYPTGAMESPMLSGDEEKIYNLIVRRFLSLFCDDAIIDNKTVKATVDGLVFNTKGSAIRKKAWLEIYPSKLKEIEIPDMNGKVKIIDLKTEQKETQPPKRYSPASIISQLEKKNLGTKATRSSILETLYDRGYVQGKSIEATPLGISLIETLEKYSPIIIDEKLTRKFEQEMDSIVSAKKDFEKKEEKIINEAKKTITNIAKDFEKNEKKIGEELVQANQDYREQQKIENTLMQCPKCQARELLEKKQFLAEKIPNEKQKFSRKGNLAITYSKKNRRSFVACNAYPECKNTYSLPPNGLIKKAEKLCESCGFPMLMRLSKGKRPWTFCFNPECKTNKERMSAYANRQKEEKNNYERGGKPEEDNKKKAEENNN
jgi:DNA topoisomerase-1